MPVGHLISFRNPPGPACGLVQLKRSTAIAVKQVRMSSSVVIHGETNTATAIEQVRTSFSVVIYGEPRTATAVEQVKTPDRA